MVNKTHAPDSLGLLFTGLTIPWQKNGKISVWSPWEWMNLDLVWNSVFTKSI